MNFPTFEPPKDAIRLLRSEHDIQTFVETGTYKGETSLWASKIFANVYTVEASRSLFTSASQPLGNIGNISCFFGDSREHLQSIIGKLVGPACFWLDSHWCGDETASIGTECPVIDEIELITRSKIDHFLIVDDARYFLSPPPKPHVVDNWPTIVELIDALSDSGRRHIIVAEDAVFAIPMSLKQPLVDYYRNRNTVQPQVWINLPARNILGLKV